MSEPSTDNSGTDAATAAEDAAAQQLLAQWAADDQTPQQTQQTTQQTQTSDQAQDVKSLPDWAQKLITDTRSEAAQHRTGKNEAEQKYQGTLDAIAKALGLKDDDPPDPDRLAQQVTSEQTRARDAQVQLAVYRRAGANGASGDALLDSASFLRTLTDVDPDNDAAVDAAIKAAVEKNPNLAAQRVTPGVRDAAQGSNASAGGATVNDLIRAAAGR